MSKALYSIVVPLYNEQEVLPTSYARLKAVLETLDGPYELIFVNDGSKDKTLEMAKELCEKDKTLRLISFARNFGHQAAITAGMNAAEGDAIVVIDADLQDPPEVILDMVKKWKEGYDVVYGKREKRDGESAFKLVTAKAFYRILKSLTDVDIPVDTGDFRLLDKKVNEALKTLPERNRYVRGLVSWVGFKQTGVFFHRQERAAGETKYTLKKMLKLAGDGIVSFSSSPLKLGAPLGIGVCGLSALGFILYLILSLVGGYFALNTALLFAILFVSGLILTVFGITGLYFARLYDEVKGRPMYIIGEKVNFD